MEFLLPRRTRAKRSTRPSSRFDKMRSSHSQFDEFASYFQDSVRVYLDRLYDEIVELQAYHHDADPFETFKIFHTIVSRLIEHPNNLKYQKLKKSNQKINKHLLRYEASVDMLRFIGFRVEFETNNDKKMETEEVDTSDCVWVFYGDANTGKKRVVLLETVQTEAHMIVDNLKRARQKPAEVILETIRCAPAGLRFMFQPDKSESHLSESRRFLGIKNVGAVCYLNSMMQVLFFNASFRRLIFSVARPEDGDVDEVKDDTQYIIYTLQEFFYHLSSRRSSRALDPSMLLKAFGWNAEQMHEQRDVSEFHMLFLNKIEEGFKGMTQFDSFRTSIYGKEAIRNYSDEVGYQSIKERPFFAITLQLTNDASNLEEALCGYIEGTHDLEIDVDGVGPTLCQQQWELHELPPVLHFHLQRFEIDSTTWQCHKRHDRLEFPTEFDMSPYVADADLEEGSMMYELYGVLVHSGTTNAGHYWAYIKCSVVEDGDERRGWYCMNDSHVEETDWETVKTFAFGTGGEEVEIKDSETRPMSPEDEMRKKLASIFGADIEFVGGSGGMDTRNPQFASAYMLIYVARDNASDIMSALESDYRLPSFHDLQTAIQKTDALRVSKFRDDRIVNDELIRRGLQPKQLCYCGKCLQQRQEQFK